MRHLSEAQQRVSEFHRGSVGLSLVEGGFVGGFAALIVKSNLVRACGARPAQFKGRRSAVVIKPRRLARSMPVCALPYLANPATINHALPTAAARRRQAMRCKGAAFRWVLKHTAPAPHGIYSGSKTPCVVARPVVLATPSLVVHYRQRAPQLARRVCHNRPRPSVEPRVSMLRP